MGSGSSREATARHASHRAGMANRPIRWAPTTRELGCGITREVVDDFSSRTRLDSGRSQGRPNEAQRHAGINVLHHDLNEAWTRREEGVCMSRDGNWAATSFTPIVCSLEIPGERQQGIFVPNVDQLCDRTSQMRVRDCSFLSGKSATLASSTKIFQKLFD
jgi:hypothetical protein